MNSAALLEMLEFAGSPVILDRWRTTAYFSAGINGLALLYDLSHFFYEEEINVKVGYILLGFASLIGTACNVIYFAGITNNARGLETLCTIYYGFFWLSCILTILQLARRIEDNTKKTKLFINWCTGLTIAWFLISISAAIASEVFFAVEDFINNSLSLSLARFVYVCQCFYVVTLLVLHVKFFSKLKKAYAEYRFSIVSFTIFSILPVCFNTLSLTVISPHYSIIGDILTLIAMFLFLNFAKKWIPLEQAQETADNNNGTV